MMRFGYRQFTKLVRSGDDFDPTIVGNPGRVVFDGWDKELYNYFLPRLEVSFRSNLAVATALLELVDHDEDRDPAIVGSPTVVRKVLLRDTTGTLTDFVENNLGLGWVITPRQLRVTPMELWFTTTGAAASAKAMIVEYWYEPRWPSADLAEFLSCLPATLREFLQERESER